MPSTGGASRPASGTERRHHALSGPMTRQRWMAGLFAAGSSCFLIGPFPGYVNLVGPTADAITFFAGSILYTAGGALQLSLAVGGRRADWWAAAIQSAGTLFFNVSTF